MRTQALFADLKLPQFSTHMLFLLSNVAYNALIQICTIQKYYFEKATFRTAVKTELCMQYFVEIYGFAICELIICGLGILLTGTPYRNLRIFNSGMSPRVCGGTVQWRTLRKRGWIA